MPRNSELVRQWEILRDIDGAQCGVSVAKLSAARGVHQRTIRRDIDALGRAGFPLYDEKVNGTTMWKLRASPFGRLQELGLGLTELCALYLSRTLLGTLTGAPLQDDAERAFVKLERALPAATKRFLDQLPRTLQAKSGGRKKQDERRMRDIFGRVLDATLLHRRAEMQYVKVGGPSIPDGKTYVIEPQRIAYAAGGIYLVAWVPAYGEMRTFAVERIRTFALLDETFAPRALPMEPFANSLGVNTGTAERVLVEFDAAAAPWVREREWHRSQSIDDRPDGSIVLTLNVCNDYALRTWILGFGPEARVVSPESLAREIADTAHLTWRRYHRQLRTADARLDMLKVG